LPTTRYCPKNPDDPSDTQEGEGRDRATIELNAGQAELVAALRAAVGPGVPLVGVLVHGGAVALGEATRGSLDALLDAWQPGMGGGAAIADALLGAYNPGGRSPVTWYKSTADLPRMGEMDLYAGDGLTYVFSLATTLLFLVLLLLLYLLTTFSSTTRFPLPLLYLFVKGTGTSRRTWRCPSASACRTPRSATRRQCRRRR
jgi:hypothetical protein